MVHKPPKIEGFITEREGDFVATFGVNNTPNFHILVLMIDTGSCLCPSVVSNSG